MSNSRVWLFRVLVLTGAGLMLYSWFQPWWAADIFELSKNAVIIHPWALEQHVGEIGYIAGSEMPAFFTPFMWTYLGLCIALLLFSLFAKDKAIGLGKFKLPLPQMLVGGVGLSYIVIVVLAVVVAAIRTGEFGLALLGTTFIEEPYPGSDVTGKLLFGYWLACGVGPLLIVIALLRNKIIGNR